MCKGTRSRARRKKRLTHGPNLRLLNIPDAGGRVDVAREDIHDLLARRGHQHQRAAVEVETRGIFGRGRRVQEGACCLL